MIFDEKMQELPVVTFEKPKIIMTGKSIPADADNFYIPLIRKFEEIIKCWPSIELIYLLDYYNTSSLYYLTRIMDLLNSAPSYKSVKVEWNYLETDEIMEEVGTDYKLQYRNIKFTLNSKK